MTEAHQELDSPEALRFGWGTALLLALSLFVSAAGLCAQNVSKSVVDAGVAAAESWLGMVDSGEYGRSWDQSSELSRDAISRKKFDKYLTLARKPMGNVVSRKVESARHATSLPGAREGEYVVIRFATVFTERSDALETVTVMKEPDGVWRVAGYSIK